MLILTIALLLDAALGEPRWLWQHLPHPAVLIGRSLTWAERRFNRGHKKRAKGLGVILAMVITAWLMGSTLALAGPVVEIVLAAILLAQRALCQHVSAVADGLRLGLPQGRRAVTMIVSRDTSAMDTPQTSRAAIESGAENLSDGVIAPALWFAVGGLGGMLAYKVVNTADSMIGYRTARYSEFGWAAARLDDLMNWIPARITAVLIALPGGILNQWPAIRTDAALHKSPNAGWPEAAMARAIDVALAGPRAYDGVMQQFAWVHPTGTRHPGPVQIDAAVTRLWQAWGVAVAGCFILGLLT